LNLSRVLSWTNYYRVELSSDKFDSAQLISSPNKNEISDIYKNKKLIKPILM
jgi:hypothetical protein